MKQSLKSLTNLNMALAALSILLYALVNFMKKFLSDDPRGDEGGYLKSFNSMLENGFFDQTIEGHSISFNLLSRVFHFLGFSPLISIRLTAFVSGVLALYLIWIILKRFTDLSLLYRRIALVTSANVMVVSSYFLVGTTDLLLALLIVFYFYFLLKRKSWTTWGIVISAAVVALMMLTRQVAILLIPSIALVELMHIRRNKKKVSELIKPFLIGIMVFGVIVTAFNMPSILDKSRLSYHKKIPSNGLSWTQLQYLSALETDRGNLQHGKHVSWDYLQQYLDENGESSLPSTPLESLLFDPGLTIKEFFVDLFQEIKPFTRLMGALFLFSLGIFLIELRNPKRLWSKIMNNEILVFSMIYISIICLIVIYYVETRWLISVLLLLPVVFSEVLFKFFEKRKISSSMRYVLLNLHLLSISLMNIPYLWANFT